MCVGEGGGVVCRRFVYVPTELRKHINIYMLLEMHKYKDT